MRPFDPRLFLRDEELEIGLGLILAASRALVRAGEAARRSAGLNSPEWDLLMAIRMAPGRDLGAVRHALGATVPSFARHLAALDKAGLIAKAVGTQDGRQRRLYLSDAGRAATDPAADAMRELLARAYRKAGGDPVAGTRAVLEALTP